MFSMFGERPKHLKHLKHLKDWARAQATFLKVSNVWGEALGLSLRPILSFFNVLNVVNVWASPQIFKTFIHLKHLKPLGP